MKNINQYIDNAVWNQVQSRVSYCVKRTHTFPKENVFSVAGNVNERVFRQVVRLANGSVDIFSLLLSNPVL